MYMQIHKTDFREILEEHNYLMPYPINLIFSELGDNQVFFKINKKMIMNKLINLGHVTPKIGIFLKKLISMAKLVACAIF